MICKLINASRFQFICLLCCVILVVRPKFSIRPNQTKARTHWIRMRSSLPRDTVSTELHQCREITRASRDQPLINNSLHHTHSDIATLTAPASLGTAEQWHPDKPNKNKAERKLWTRQSTLNRNIEPRCCRTYDVHIVMLNKFINLQLPHACINSTTSSERMWKI